MNVKLLILIFYLSFMVIISVLVNRRAKKKMSGDEDEALAGRKLPVVAAAFMVAATAIGGASTVGVAQNAYNMGASAGFYSFAWAIGAVVFALLFAKKIRAAGFSTLNEIYSVVWGKAFGTVVLLVCVVAFTLNTANQLVSAGSILVGLMPETFNLTLGIVVTAVICVLVAFFGGMLGASFSNIFSVILIYVGTFIAMLVVLASNGSFQGLSESLPADVEWWSLYKGAGASVLIAWVFTFICSSFYSEIVFQATASCETPKKSRNAILIAALIIAPSSYICGVLGTAARALFPNLENTALALPNILQTVPDWVAGLCIAGLWAAVVSTIVGIVICIASMFTKGIVVSYFKPEMSQKKQNQVFRIVIIAVIIIAGFIALQISEIIKTVLAAIALLSPLAWLIFSYFVFPRNMCRKSTCWWAWGAGSLAYLACTFFAPGLRLFGQTIYTTILFTIIGWAISLLVDKRTVNALNYVESVD